MKAANHADPLAMRPNGMLGALLKKQILEMFRGFFVDQKTGKGKPKTKIILSIVLYALLMVGFLGGTFAVLAVSVCMQLADLNLGWLYYLVMSLISIVFGVFGSVFSTYSSVYLAKDNEALLSMPIPIRTLLTSRLLGVYLMGMMYSYIVLIPAVAVYLILTPFTVNALLGGIVMMVLVSFIDLILSCVLGWVVAKIASKLKNKSFVTVLISVAFIVLYYVIYFRATDIISDLAANAVLYGEKIRSSAYFVYLFGRVGEGDLLAMGVYIAVIAVLTALTLYVMKCTFIGIVTSSEKTKKAVYRERTVKQQSAFRALLAKEFKRFVSSPIYMLNCGIGILLLPVVGVALLINVPTITVLLKELPPPVMSFIYGLFCAGLCMLGSMNTITAPAVSLEGKNIWILQTLPVSGKQILQAKLSVELILGGIPLLFCTLCAAIAFRMSLLWTVLLLAFSIAFTFLHAGMGLYMNLKHPNLSWTTEAMVVKQGLPVFVALFGAWIYGGAIGLASYFAMAYMDVIWVVLGFTALTAVLAYVVYRWLMTKGSAIFAKL